MRHIHHLDDRISVLEAKLLSVQFPLSGEAVTSAEYSDVTNVMRRLSLQVAGIQRLRRDVSHLQVSRRERQDSVQHIPDQCSCPAGMFIYIFAFDGHT